MSAVPTWFKPLKQIVDAVFRHDLALQRDEHGVRVVLNGRGAGRASPSPAKVSAAQEKLELELMRSQLAAVLDDRLEARNTLRHLAFVEQALGRKGLRALDKLPLDLMRHALAQLEGLVTNWSPVGLAHLRAKLAVAVLQRESVGQDGGPDSYRTSTMYEPGLPRDAASAVVLQREEEDALAAAYAAYAAVTHAPTAPGDIAIQGELGSPSERAVRSAEPASSSEAAVRRRQLQP